jgi:hypothetical protein
VVCSNIITGAPPDVVGTTATSFKEFVGLSVRADWVRGHVVAEDSACFLVGVRVVDDLGSCLQSIFIQSCLIIAVSWFFVQDEQITRADPNTGTGSGKVQH